MQLPDGQRHVLAALVASTVFLGLFFAANLVWFAAVFFAVLIYLAVILIIPRRRALSEIKVAARVSAEELETAARALEDASQRIAAAAQSAPEKQKSDLNQMAEDLSVIRGNILDDPEELRVARTFINVHLSQVVSVVEGFAKLEAQKTPQTAARIAELGDRIHDFSGPIRRIRNAASEADLNTLDIEAKVLSNLLNRQRSRL